MPGYLRQPYNTERYFWIRVFDDASLRRLPIHLGCDFFSENGSVLKADGSRSAPRAPNDTRSDLPKYTAKNSEKGKDVQVFLVAQEEVSVREDSEQGVSVAIAAKHGPHSLPAVQIDPSLRAEAKAVVDLHPFSATNTRPG